MLLKPAGADWITFLDKDGGKGEGLEKMRNCSSVASSCWFSFSSPWLFVLSLHSRSSPPLREEQTDHYVILL